MHFDRAARFMSDLLFDFSRDDFYVSALAHRVGSVRRTLDELARDGLLSGSEETLRQVGYQYNCSVAPGTSLTDFVADVCRQLIQDDELPKAVAVHHSYSVNTSEAPPCGSRDLLARANYFPASLLRRLGLDHVPYCGSYATGCTGFMSLLVLAASLLKAKSVDNVMCLTADLKPPGTTYDSARERLLTSDATSGFIANRIPRGFQVIGVGHYSSSRELIPLVEVVKRAVQMTQQLLDLSVTSEESSSMLCHYPNMFVEAWRMVSHFLKIPKENELFDGMAERAHCLSSDAIISLENVLGTTPGRMHAVYSFGSGLHLAVAILREV